ncbi:MAG: sulfite exporter TauE/SafE family protein [Ilumatobacter sp.]|nr:sulfite exporter TauE/SafE family protein [Ilumatobacter sp.]
MLAAEVIGLSPWWAAVAVLIVFVGSATQASIGIGLGLLAAPTLVLIDTAFIPGALSVCVVPLTIGMTIREFDHVDRRIYRAAVGRFVGVVTGAIVIAVASRDVVAIVIALSVLLAVVGSISGLRFATSDRNLMIAGTASGFTGTVAAIGGPPMALTYQHSDPRTLRATLAAFNTIGSSFTIPSLAIAGVIGRRELQLAALLVPGVVAGLWLGRIGIARLPADRVRGFVLAICAGSALVLLGRQLL